LLLRGQREVASKRLELLGGRHSNRRVGRGRVHSSPEPCEELQHEHKPAERPRGSAFPTANDRVHRGSRATSLTPRTVSGRFRTGRC
jgi:hypothetical protein